MEEIRSNDSTEDVDEFARPPTCLSDDDVVGKTTNSAPSVVEIISTVHESQKTRTPQETEEYLLWSVGDLPEKDRKNRSLQEACWTTQKKSLKEFYIAPPPPPTHAGQSLLILGTNGHACYALGMRQELFKNYLQGQQNGERMSAILTWKTRTANAQTQGEAKALHVYLHAIAQKDPVLAPVAIKYMAKLDALIPTLPEVLDEVVPPIPGDRPGKLQPEILLYEPLPPPRFAGWGNRIPPE